MIRIKTNRSMFFTFEVVDEMKKLPSIKRSYILNPKIKHISKNFGKSYLNLNISSYSFRISITPIVL